MRYKPVSVVGNTVVKPGLPTLALARLPTVLPITPGGLGLVELGLTGVLSVGLDDPTLARVSAAVLLFRAVTYLLPICSVGARSYWCIT